MATKRKKRKTTKRRRDTLTSAGIAAKCRRKKTFHGAPVYETLL